LNKKIFTFLKNYETNVNAINKLLVSTFLIEKNIYNLKNRKIKSLIITKNELEYPALLDFVKIIKKENISFCFEELLELFEFVISPSDKLVNGAIYTPKNIRNYITTQSFNALETQSFNKVKVVDIACGCGGFLIDASRELKAKTDKSYKKIFQENIYGVDIQKYSVERTEILLSLLAITANEDEEEFDFNIYQGDSLKYNWQDSKFDLILGNPPYVCSRNMDEETKKSMKEWSSCKTGHPDLYIPFFQIGYELLKENGVLGYITVNSFINSVNGRAIREYFEKQKTLIKIVDFGDEQVFQSRMTYTCLCFIQKNHNGFVLYAQEKSTMLNELKKLDFVEEKYNNLDSFKGWNKEDEKYYYINENTPIEKGVCKDIINSNKLAKYDNVHELFEKIIFPYKHDKDGKPMFIKKDEFTKNYPRAYKYLSTKKELLSTRDKGKGKYPDWYAFGRNQSLEKRKEKLFFPQLVKKGFKTFYSEDENLYFYNGMCAYASKKELKKLQKIMRSDKLWKYIETRAKHYASGYYGLGRNYLKDFGII